MLRSWSFPFDFEDRAHLLAGEAHGGALLAVDPR
jgi:hypothetical protein